MSASPTLTAATALGEASPVAEDARAFLRDRLDRVAGRPRTLVVAVPAAVAPPEALLALSADPCGVLWDPPAGRSIAGVGAAWRIDLSGPSRFRRLRQEAARLWESLAIERHPAAPEPAPRLLGGLAFDVGSVAVEPWEELGDGGFTLPRFTYLSDGDSACLAVATRTDGGLGAARGEALADEAARLLAGLEAAAARGAAEPRTGPGSGSFPGRVLRPSRAEWVAQVEAVRRAIAAGRCEKIVVARRSVVELPRPIDPVVVLRRLARGLRASTRFAFRRGRSVFLGATPERLVARRGRRLETEALAGSTAIGFGNAARLLASRKDLGEHRLVLDEIVRRVAPLCETLEVAERVQVRELREVLHLLTPIVGVLRRPCHVLELVETLHPTPAVGGVPTETALGWIRDHEPDGRGWYAGPVGWFDAAGDGEFAVALRSSLVRGRRAFLYAGAGIVRDSDPGLEVDETELKEQVLLNALGAND